MYLVCWNHDCRQTYDAKNYSVEDRDVKCEKCEGTLISPSGKVTLSANPHVIKTVDPDEGRKEMKLKMYEFESGVTDWICATTKEEAIGIYKSYYGETAYIESLETHQGNVDEFVKERDENDMFTYYPDGLHAEENSFGNFIKKYFDKPGHFATSEF